MDKAKEAGRNGYRFYTAEMNERALERLEVETGLRRALEASEFALHFQPKFEVRNRRLGGAEALLRWQRQGHGLVASADFVPLLEETGLIQPVGAWMIRQACRQIAAWRHAHVSPGPVAINVSARQFQNESLLLDLAEALKASGIPPAMLEVEITESVLASRRGGVLAIEYGPGPFGGVPAERLPAPRSCRVWYERTEPERQPPQTACPRAEQRVRESGGRLLYMPASDLK